VYLDTETTGTRNSDTVIEVAVIDHDGAVLVDSLVRPGKKIPPDASRIHGIRDADVQDAPAWGDVWPEVEAAIQGRNVGLYNQDFDLRLIRQTHKLNWMNWKTPPGTEFFDIMLLYAQYKGDWNTRRGGYRWHSLENAGRQCGIPLPNTHRAKDDTLLTRALLHHMAQAMD
jgi:DNA polymerase-3 subunit epsilon